MNITPEELVFHGRDLFIYFPNGQGVSKLPMANIERTLQAAGTARNWNTVLALLAAGLASCSAPGGREPRITQVLGVKVQPMVLGHHLMLVTPRDVAGEPPRGSNSNGVVFRCAFGSDNLPPVTDGVLADTERHGHLPAFNQTFREFGLPIQWSEEEYGRKLLIGGGLHRDRACLCRGLGGNFHGVPRPGLWPFFFCLM